MTRRALAHLAGAVASVALGSAIGLGWGPADPVLAGPRAASARVLRDALGRAGVRDASGRFVPILDYRRIVSGSTVADGLLLALADPSRVLAYTEVSTTRSPYAYRFAGKAAAVDLDDLEALIALEPDLLVVSGVRRQERAARAREAGLAVLDLGESRGLESLVGAARVVGTILGRAEHGQQLAHRIARRMEDLAARTSPLRRPRGVYVSVHGGVLFGGTRGTSYHDVLTAAGIIDAAARAHTGWPRYATEQLLGLDPDLLVTQTGMAAVLCRHPGLDRLRACQATGRIIEIDAGLIGDPGVAMLDAAEALYERVHAEPAAVVGPAS